MGEAEQHQLMSIIEETVGSIGNLTGAADSAAADSATGAAPAAAADTKTPSSPLGPTGHKGDDSFDTDGRHSLGGDFGVCLVLSQL
jgi:hypothetical protein